MFYDWHAFALTSHTNNADIWHGTFTFQTGFGTTKVVWHGECRPDT